MPFIKGHPQLNTGKTHFKKGLVPWNKGISYVTSNPKKIAVKMCMNCNQEFEIENWRLKDPKRGKFCSIICNNKFHSGENSHYFGRKLIGNKSPSWKGGIPDCIDCGKKLSIYYAKRCQKCNLKFHTGENHPFYRKPMPQLRGANHPAWKGGKRKRNILMGQIEYKIWREAVFARDNWTCTECHIRGGKLNADHIKPWSQYPELRYAIDNGRTLCLECHMKTDSYPKQFIRRISN